MPAIGVISALVIGLLSEGRDRLSAGAGVGAITGRVTGFGAVLGVVLVNGLVTVRVARLAKKPVMPNQGIRRSAYYGLAISLVVCLGVGLLAPLQNL